MVDRVALVAALANVMPPLSVSANMQAEKALNKVIAQFVLLVPLEAARAMSGQAASDLRAALADVLGTAELKKLSQCWDRKRTVAKDVAQRELAAHLRDLLDRKREPFDPTPRPLKEVRALDGASRARLINDFAKFSTVAQLKAYIKKLDRNSKVPENASRESLLKQFSGLVSV